MTLTMQTDGNLVARLNTGKGSGQVVWSSGTSGNSGAYAVMQTDGNLVVYKNGGGPGTGGALSSKTYGKRWGRRRSQLQDWPDHLRRDTRSYGQRSSGEPPASQCRAILEGCPVSSNESGCHRRLSGRLAPRPWSGASLCCRRPPVASLSGRPIMLP